MLTSLAFANTITNRINHHAFRQHSPTSDISGQDLLQRVGYVANRRTNFTKMASLNRKHFCLFKVAQLLLFGVNYKGEFVAKRDVSVLPIFLKFIYVHMCYI